MDDSGKPDEGKKEAETPNAGVAQPTEPPPQQPPANPNTRGTEDNPQPPQPILVRLVGGDDLKPFEVQSLAIATESLAISRRTYGIAIFGFFAALAAAVFVGTQVYEMTRQTVIMASQSEGANAGALMDEMNTRKQLGVMQEQAHADGIQAKAAQESVGATTKQCNSTNEHG